EGVNLVYAVIKGPLEDPSEPYLSNEFSQILIGKVLVLAGAANHDNSTYTREIPPAVGSTSPVIESSSDNISISVTESEQGEVIDLNPKCPVIEIVDFDAHITTGQFRKTSTTVSANSPIDMTGDSDAQRGVLRV